MSLFIGNISRTVRTREIEKLFEEYGECTFKFKGSYAFAKFYKEKNAQSALTNLDKKNVGGMELNVEWSKISDKYSKSRRRSTSPSRRSNDFKCYQCGLKGHIARNCPDTVREYSSRHRSRRSKSRSRSRNRSRNRSNSRSRSRKRSTERTDKEKERKSKSNKTK